MGKPKPPPPPDYSELAEASKLQAELNYKLGQEQLAWAREQYAKDSEFYSKIVDGYMSDSEYNRANAEKDREFYETFFQPLEQELAEEAKNYDTPERREREMGGAQAAIAEQFDIQRENAQRELEAYGIDPTSTRYGALDIGMRTAQAASQAAAGTAANNRVEDTARALRGEAINVGRGYPSQVAQGFGTASQAAAGAGGTVGQATQIGGQTMGTATQYLGGANQSIGTWGNILNTSYQNQLDHHKAQSSTGIGGVLGLIGGFGMRRMGFEDGGVVPEPGQEQYGGPVTEGMSPSRGEVVDDVPAQLNAGEFVIPDDVVSWYGEKHMYGLIEKANKEREQSKQATGAIPDEMYTDPRQQPVFQSA